ANYWGDSAGVGDLPPYVEQAFKLFRNYDGKGGTFGDIAVKATVPDPATASIYAAKNSKNPGELTVIVINKDQQKRFQGMLQVGAYKQSKVFVLDGSGPEIKPQETATVVNGTLEYELHPLSATLFALTK